MLRPKVAGTWLLHQLTADADLDLFVLFSSTTALWGSRALGHYAAANQFLDALAHHRRAPRPARAERGLGHVGRDARGHPPRSATAIAALRTGADAVERGARGARRPARRRTTPRTSSSPTSTGRCSRRCTRLGGRGRCSPRSPRRRAERAGPCAATSRPSSRCGSPPPMSRRRREVVVGFLRDEVAGALGVADPCDGRPRPGPVRDGNGLADVGRAEGQDRGRRRQRTCRRP